MNKKIIKIFPYIALAIITTCAWFAGCAMGAIVAFLQPYFDQLF